MDEWISIEERLPEFGEAVLLAEVPLHSDLKTCPVLVGYLHRIDGTGYHFKTPPSAPHGREEMQWRFTHWMPLPDPPKEESGG